MGKNKKIKIYKNILFCFPAMDKKKDLSKKLMRNKKFMAGLKRAKKDLKNCNYVRYEELNFGEKTPL